MAKYAGQIRIGPSDIRRVSGGVRSGGSHKSGWGLETISMGSTLSIPEARRRLRRLKDMARDTGTGILLGAGEVIADAWRENIDAEGYGPSGSISSDIFDEDDLSLEERGYTEGARDASRSTGRYYNSIRVEVDQDLEVHVGSNIPAPSGRGLTRASYPEVLEFGAATFTEAPRTGFRFLTRALDESGQEMEKEMVKVFNAANKLTLMQGR